jgi:hypothetical protein
MLKDWKKDKDRDDYITFVHNEQKDYNVGRPKHLQVSEAHRLFSKNVLMILKQWKMSDVEEHLESKALWIVRDMNSTISKTFKNKSDALKFAKSYMRSH